MCITHYTSEQHYNLNNIILWHNYFQLIKIKAIISTGSKTKIGTREVIYKLVELAIWIKNK